MSKEKRIRQWVMMFLLCCLLAGCGGEGSDGYLIGESVGSPTEQATEAEETGVSGALLYVYVCGHVRNPGVYALTGESRIQDAVTAAGGFDEEADTEYWNLAEIVTDGQQIRVPSLEEGASEAAAAEAAGAASGLVNLNTATREELMTLTGIGEVKADAIISYREANGNFTSIEEIMNVSGIKEAGFEKIRDQITV